MKKLLIILIGLHTAVMVSGQVSVHKLRCEMLTNPLGIDETEPRLSWQIQSSRNNVTQLAYQVLVASSPDKLAKDEGDIWNPGKIEGNRSINVPYQGNKLA